MKTVELGKILTEAELRVALRMWKHSKTNYAKRVATQLIEPNIARINASLGQENVPLYLGYAVEYAVREIERK